MKARLSILMALALAIPILSGCQTPRHKEFDRIQEGMLKDEVIEAAGGPTISERWQGKDRWTYVFFQDGQRVKKEVHFDEGKVIYRGDPPRPKVSAAEQDRLNEDSNARAEIAAKREMEAKNEARRQFFSEEPTAAEESRKIVPTFKPVQ